MHRWLCYLATMRSIANLVGLAVAAFTMVGGAQAQPAAPKCDGSDPTAQTVQARYASLQCAGQPVAASMRALNEAFATQVRAATPARQRSLQRQQDAWIAAYPWNCDDDFGGLTCQHAALGKRLGALLGPPNLRTLTPEQRFAALARAVTAYDGLVQLSAATVTLRQDVRLVDVPVGKEITLTGAQLGKLFLIDFVDDLAFAQVASPPADHVVLTRLSIATSVPCSDADPIHQVLQIAWTWDRRTGAITRVDIAPDPGVGA